MGALKRYQDALQCCEQALALQPNYPEAWLNKGSAYSELKQFSQALNCYNQAIELNNDFADAWYSKGVALDKLDQQQEALNCYNKALELNPSYAKAWLNKGSIYTTSNQNEQALECYQNALNLEPESKFLSSMAIFIKGKIGDWGGYESDVSSLLLKLHRQEIAALPFTLLSLTDDRNSQVKAAQEFTKTEHPPQNLLGPIQKYSNPKIKIAYFSADFKDHPVSYLTAELFELHDRNQFEVYGFSLKQANNSPIRERLIAGFDHFIEVDDKTDIEIATLVRNLQIDIAIDLGGHTQDARTGIFAHRAAPIQVNFLGFAGTMGASYIDYIVADKIVIPEEHKDFYLEKKAYLPNSYMVDDSMRLPSSKQFFRADFGLPEDGVIFCCFNNSYKFNPPRIASFAKILSNTPNSILWISENNTSFKKNLLAEFTKLGIPENRIIFAGRVDALEDHLARYRLADIFLDTSPYNAHTTALDSLKAGVPIISLAGQSFASRVGASLLTAIGLPELIVHSEQEFIDLASRLGQHPESLKTLKDKLIANYQAMPLFNSRLFCKHLEGAYQEMHRLHGNDLPPSDIYVD
jgi:protein O-GlcNAc transferase